MFHPQKKYYFLIIFFFLISSFNTASFAKANISEVVNEVFVLDIYGKRYVLSNTKLIKKGDYLKTKKQPAGPLPVSRWEFDKNPNDSIGKMHGVLSGGAKIENGALVLNGKNSFMMTSAFENDVHEKTLEAWVQLNDLNQKGSGVIGIQSTNGVVFDSIVYGERTPQAWMAGSDTLKRSQKHDGEKEGLAFTLAGEKEGLVN